jgi:ribosome biogenesis GTP-binding protein YsxC/EngB
MKPKRLQIRYPLVSTAIKQGGFVPGQSQLQKANEFFNKCQTKLSFMVFNSSQLKQSGIKPEVMLLGRSNVGKSSLISALMYPHGKDKTSQHIKELARSSARPGFTKSLNFYNCGDKLYVVDSPGYGHRSTGEQGSIVTQYLEAQRNLRRIYILIDGVVGITDNDRATMAMIDGSGVPWQIVLTKLDKHINRPVDYAKLFSYPESGSKNIPGISEKDVQTINWTVERMLEEVEEMIDQGYGSLVEEVIGTSSNVTLNYLGIKDLRASILQACSFKGFI